MLGYSCVPTVQRAAHIARRRASVLRRTSSCLHAVPHSHEAREVCEGRPWKPQIVPGASSFVLDHNEPIGSYPVRFLPCSSGTKLGRGRENASRRRFAQAPKRAPRDLACSTSPRHQSRANCVLARLPVIPALPTLCTDKRVLAHWYALPGLTSSRPSDDSPGEAVHYRCRLRSWSLTRPKLQQVLLGSTAPGIWARVACRSLSNIF